MQREMQREIPLKKQLPWQFNKSFATNSLAVVITIIGYYSPLWPRPIFNTGIFALSGAITNWLAIYMLFEKVPYLYGSGVIPSRFEEFKSGIRSLIMEQFFTKANIERFFQNSDNALSPLASPVDLSPLLDHLDYDSLFHKLVAAFQASTFGPMLMMLGGEKALEPLKDSLIAKLREALSEIGKSPRLQQGLKATVAKALDSEGIIAKVDEIVQKRLDELTPRMVKEIIEAMIHKHLGWLVVWGGVFGGLIGFLASFVN